MYGWALIGNAGINATRLLVRHTRSIAWDVRSVKETLHPIISNGILFGVKTVDRREFIGTRIGHEFGRKSNHVTSRSCWGDSPEYWSSALWRGVKNP